MVKPYLFPAPKKIKWGKDLIDLRKGFSVKGKFSSKLGKTFAENLQVSINKGENTLSLGIKSSLPQEGYSLLIGRNSLRIEAGSKRGFFYALQTLLQLRDGMYLPEVEIEDWPSLSIRGFHISLGTNHQIKVKELKYLISLAGKFKLNTFVIEYGDRFPFAKHPVIPSSSAFTPEEIKELIEWGKKHEVDLIPLMQCLGHLSYVLKHKEYANLKEGGEEKAQLCPLNPASFQLFTELAGEMLLLHSESKYFHIGGDETRELGVCPLCKEYAKKKGKGSLYVEYVNKVINWVKKRGKIPIIWDDMLCHFPASLNLLDKEAIIMYWDYWATKEKVPFVIPRPKWNALTYDKRWDTQWKDELGLLERKILYEYGKPVDLEKELEGEYLSQFKDYLGEEFPKYIHAFPYLKFYLDKGFKVIGAGSMVHNFLKRCPDYEHERAFSNIKEFCRCCIEKNALGFVATSWQNTPAELYHPGILWTAKFGWEGTG